MAMTRKKRKLWLASIFLCGAAATWLPVVAASAPTAALPGFGSETEMQAYLGKLQGLKERDEEKARLAREREQRKWERKIRRALASNASLSKLPNSTGNINGSTAAGGTVVIENKATGFRRELTADADGNYSFRSLPMGTYEVTAGGVTRSVTVSIGSTANLGTADTVGVIGGGVPTGNEPSSESDDITNVQTAGIDEGGLVKKAGDYLVVLRRGRLFTIKATDAELKVISAIDAFGPGLEAEDSWSAWYDEMLISDDNIVVIGYSYGRSGTEIGLFHLSPDGKASYRATYHLLSDDYYSSRNYASRLVGDALYFYTPFDLFAEGSKLPVLPGLRRWSDAGEKGKFETILTADRLYRSGIGQRSWRQTLHSVTRCQIRDADLDCRSTAVLGPPSGTFYVSKEAVYVWTMDWYGLGDDAKMAPTAVYRIPLDESAPTALKVQGNPIDQLSFLEKDGYLNVLVGAESGGQRMWQAEGPTGGLALLRVPLARFGGINATTIRADYRALPSGAGDDGFWSLHNRFIGDWLVYGSEENHAPGYAIRIDGEKEATRLNLGHDVERVEAMGKNALIVGNARLDSPQGSSGRARRVSTTVMTSIALEDDARIATQYAMPNASQSEDRTHGFFYRSLAADEGVFGLPIQLSNPESAIVKFLRNIRLKLSGIGELEAKPSLQQDDGCRASCYDWYGDARPIFIGDRVYGLMGYELIEGELIDGRIRERRRIDFTPSVPAKK